MILHASGKFKSGIEYNVHDREQKGHCPSINAVVA